MSEPQAEQTHGQGASVGAGSTVPTSSDPLIDKVMASLRETAVESPAIAPDQEETAPKPDAPKLEAAKPEQPKIEAEAAKPEAPRFPGNVMIMSPGGRSWDSKGAEAKVDAEPVSGASGKRRFAAMAAVVALATVAGALGGALATAGLAQFNGQVTGQVTGQVSGQGAAAAGSSALEASVARIDADIAALKAGLDHTSKMSVSQLSKTNDRLDKIEKAQAEPSAKLAKLSEAVEKLRSTPPAAPAAAAAAIPVAAKEVTGSVTAPQGAAAVPVPAASPVPASVRPEVARLPTVEGWVLRDVGHGGALIQGRAGLYEVYAGDPVPGLGRVDAIRKQDGRWVVVTSKGLIVAR